MALANELALGLLCGLGSPQRGEQGERVFPAPRRLPELGGDLPGFPDAVAVRRADASPTGSSIGTPKMLAPARRPPDRGQPRHSAARARATATPRRCRRACRSGSRWSRIENLCD